MKPSLRVLDTTDSDALPTADGRFAPPDRQHFGLQIDAHIGPANGQGQEVFQFTACSPSWMVNEIVPGGAHWLRHYLLLESWSYDEVAGAVAKLCASIEEPTWREVALKLSRYMLWEFEDFNR